MSRVPSSVFSKRPARRVSRPNLIEPLEDRRMLSTVELVKDLNAATDSVESGYFYTAPGSPLAYYAGDGRTKPAFQTDGTTVGTSVAPADAPPPDRDPRLKVNGDIYYADAGSVYKADAAGNKTLLKTFGTTYYPGWFTYVNGWVIFSAYETTHGDELWRTDGTPAGTTLVKDISPGLGSSAPADFLKVGNAVYFTAGTSTNPRLYRTDATPEGTVLVQGTYTKPTPLAGVGSTVYFTATTAATGAEVWKYDGVSASASLLSDVRPGPDSSNPYSLRGVGNTLYFSATDGVHGAELWRSDGTAAGTSLVVDLWPGAHGSNPSSLFEYNGKLLLMADNGLTGGEPFVSDGTAAGTRLLRDINTTPLGSGAVMLGAYNGYLYFGGDDRVSDIGTELYRTDGTPGGTVLVKDLSPGPTNTGFVGDLVPFHGQAYFLTTLGLWKTDGTAAGSAMVQSVLGAKMLTVFNDKLVFKAGTQWWTSDGTAAGTSYVELFPSNSTAAFEPYEWMPYHGLLYFQSGTDLWATDLTPAGTRLVKDTSSRQYDGPCSFIVWQDALYFVAPADDGMVDLWRSDGTAAGTLPLGSVYPSSYNYPVQVKVINGLLYAVCGQAQALVRTDGTVQGTQRTSMPYGFSDAIGLGSGLLLSMGELYRSDAAGAGTVLVKDINPSIVYPYDSTPTFIGSVDGVTYFSATDGAQHGYETWRTDGTTAGTQMVGDLSPGPSSPTRYQSMVVGDTIYLVLDTTRAGRELFKIAPDHTPPTVVGATFGYTGSAPAISVQFSENVGASLAAALPEVVSSSGRSVTPTFLGYDPGTNTARYALPIDVPDGNYRLTFAAGSFADLDANVATATFGYDFYTLRGDANRDRIVNFGDLLILAKNYGATGKSFADGDFDGNGTVNFGDLLILAKAYGTTLAAPVPPAPGALATVAPATTSAVLKDDTGKKPLSSDSTPHPAPKPRPAAARPPAHPKR